MANKTIKFGLAAYKDQVAGVVLSSITEGESASEAEAMDENGNIIQTDQYAKKKTLQGEGLITVADELVLTVGGTLLIGETTYTINNVSKTSTNATHVKVTFAGSAPYQKATV